MVKVIGFAHLTVEFLSGRGDRRAGRDVKLAADQIDHVTELLRLNANRLCLVRTHLTGLYVLNAVYSGLVVDSNHIAAVSRGQVAADQSLMASQS